MIPDSSSRVYWLFHCASCFKVRLWPLGSYRTHARCWR